jgi:hypothetical protein
MAAARTRLSHSPKLTRGLRRRFDPLGWFGASLVWPAPYQRPPVASKDRAPSCSSTALSAPLGDVAVDAEQVVGVVGGGGRHSA